MSRNFKTRFGFIIFIFLTIAAGTAFGQGSGEPLFTDISREANINFVHFNGMTGKMSLPEIMGSGAAFLDYDNDGDLDIFIVQGSFLTTHDSNKDLIFPFDGGEKPSGKLFRNDLRSRPDGSRQITFTDVTKQSGISANDYGFAAASADINNDGFPDLYICNLGANQLFINNGNGTFSDRTAASMTNDPRWSVGAAFFDYDRDGFLDLAVINYAKINLNDQPKCFAPTSAPDYCGPKAFSAAGNSLFRNRGDGTFENVTVSTNFSRSFGHALGIISADFNDDGWLDLYVANDGSPNHLFLNYGNGKFAENGFLSGTAVNYQGQAEASMGVDAADFNGDGTEDIFITHLSEETHTLYRNNGDAIFDDITQKSGIARPEMRLTGFGTAFIDFDNDSVLDIFIANGAVMKFDPAGKITKTAGFLEKLPLGQRNQLFRGLGGEKFSDVSSAAGEAFSFSEISRGAAFGDVDNDGDTDILIVNNSGSARLLRNNNSYENNWIGIRLLERSGKRDALGAKVEIYLKDKPVIVRRARTDGSYASSRDPRVLAGLGKGEKIEKIRVRWTNGAFEEWRNVPVNRYIVLREGSAEKSAKK